MLTFKNFNIADWISFYRIGVSPFLLFLIFINSKEIFSWFLLLSYTTDMIDGMVARKLKITSARGSQLDSFGDQITFLIGLIGVFVFEKQFIKANLILIFLALFPYLIQMFIAFIKYGKATAFHTYLAKFSAIVQAIFILWLLFFYPVIWLFYLMIIIGLLETIEEIILIFMFDKWVSGVKGIYWVIRDKKRTGKNYK